MIDGAMCVLMGSKFCCQLGFKNGIMRRLSPVSPFRLSVNALQ
jgi:hypothetical protein